MSINLQLSVAPLSYFEAKRCLSGLTREGILILWHEQRPLNRDTCLLNLSAEYSSSDSPLWLSERLAAAIWKEAGRFVRLTSIVDTDFEGETEHLFIFEEPDYQRLMPAFRLRMPPLRR